jgi:16S rRNA (cytosine967-C5)-methyltransferase
VPEGHDIILIDAPCSGSGTIRRNPDIRLLLTEKALREQQTLQRQLLQNLWQRLMPGGTLVYSTCSVFSEENDQVIHSFLGNTADACVVNPSLATGKATQYGWQLLPTESLTDGFYYCVLEKGTDHHKANSP